MRSLNGNGCPAALGSGLPVRYKIASSHSGFLMNRSFGFPLLMALGIAGIILLAVYTGLQGIVRALATAGWGLLLLVPLHVFTIVLDSEGWRELLWNQGQRLSRTYLGWAACVRGAMNTLVPISAGGVMAGIRLLWIRGVPLAEAVGNVVVEGTLSVVSEWFLVFLTLLAALGWLHRASPSLPVVAGFLLAGAAIILGLIFWAQLNGRVFEWMTRQGLRLTTRFRSAQTPSDPQSLKKAVREIYGRPGALVRCTFWQMLSIGAGGIEIWVILRLMNLPGSLLFALLLQCLGRAARSFTFFMPGGIGIQEAVYALLAPVGQMSPAMGIAISLATRFRDLLFGLPLLASWQRVESRWIRHKRAGAAS